MKKIIYLILLITYMIAEDSMALKQQNTLHVKKLIEMEELIAKNFEKYILEKNSIPTLAQLQNSEYLGSNFSFSNRFGDNIDFKVVNNLTLKYAVSKDEVDYKNLLYERELYRKNTSTYSVKTTINNKEYINTTESYVEIKLESNEAKNLFSILKTKTIESSCNDTLTDKYCNLNDNFIRWYNSSSNWIEYSKKDFENGNVSVKDKSLLSDDKLKILPVGAYVYVKNSSTYMKLMNKNDGSLNILKVD